MIFFYYGMLWLRHRQRKHSSRARSRFLAMRRRIAAFRTTQDREIRNFLAVIAANQTTLNAAQVTMDEEKEL